MQADWSALPAVGGISIIETFDLRLHPLQLQIERSIGRRVMKYVFSGGADAHRGHNQHEAGDRHDKYSSPPRPRASMDSTPTFSTFQRPHTIVRSSSFQNLKSVGAPPRKVKKVPSSEQLVSRVEELRKSRGANNAVDMEIEEMRTRASRNRTFLRIQVSRYVPLSSRLWCRSPLCICSLTCVLSYKVGGHRCAENMLLNYVYSCAARYTAHADDSARPR
jgi:hypothetical protein